MKTVLCISSQTVAGTIASGVNSFILQCMGHRVWTIPTSLNSNHGGHPHAVREPVRDETVDGLIDNLEANGWLIECDAVLTGHFSSVGQILIAEKWISLLKARNPDLIYCCDPVMGDDAPPEYDPASGGLYVANDIARAIRDHLLPLADITSPNRFELEYLSGMACTSPKSAEKAARSLAVETVLATSIPANGRLATLCCSSLAVTSETTPLLKGVPKGTGDALIALYLGHCLDDEDNPKCLEVAVQTLYEICLASVNAGSEELLLVDNRDLLLSLAQTLRHSRR